MSTFTSRAKHGLGLVLASAVLLAGCSTTPPVAQATAPKPPRGEAIDAPSTPVTSPSPGATSLTTAPGLKIAPTDPAERAKLAAGAPAPVAKDGFTPVSFDELSGFSYITTKDGKPTPDSVMPEEIRKLDSKQVALSGFIVPIEFNEDKVSGLILVRNQLLCCFGQEPKLNEWVFVNADPPVDAVTDVPVTLYGEFFASPDMEKEQVISLYRMQANSLEVMP